MSHDALYTLDILCREQFLNLQAWTELCQAIGQPFLLFSCNSEAT